MKFRPQRGGLAESMAEVVELPDLRALAEWLVINIARLDVKPYTSYDYRTGWDTYVVTVDGQAVGFTDGPCTENG